MQKYFLKKNKFICKNTFLKNFIRKYFSRYRYNLQMSTYKNNLSPTSLRGMLGTEILKSYYFNVTTALTGQWSDATFSSKTL